MNIVILGGNSPANKLWNDGMSAVLREHFDTVSCIMYDHWEPNTPTIDLKTEAKKLEQICSSEKNCIVVAKSVGTLVSLKAIRELGIQPIACIFAGVPIVWAADNDVSLTDLLTGYKAPTLFIQQKDDPFGSFQQLKKLLAKCNPDHFTLKCIDGCDHGYTDFSKIKSLVMDYIG